jgi:hypothetical protein
MLPLTFRLKYAGIMAAKKITAALTRSSWLSIAKVYLHMIYRDCYNSYITNPKRGTQRPNQQLSLAHNHIRSKNASGPIRHSDIALEVIDALLI